jgi:hypothetical protein
MNIKTHPVNVAHLVMGLVFLGIAGSWALRQLGVIDAAGEGWTLPLILVIAGGAGLIAALAKSAPRRVEDPAYGADDEATRDLP